APSRCPETHSPQRAPAIRHHLVRPCRRRGGDVRVLAARPPRRGASLTPRLTPFLVEGGPSHYVYGVRSPGRRKPGIPVNPIGYALPAGGFRPRPPPGLPASGAPPSVRYVPPGGEAPPLGFVEATLAGLARDGGLYVPESWPALDAAAIAGFAGRPY